MMILKVFSFYTTPDTLLGYSLNVGKLNRISIQYALMNQRDVLLQAISFLQTEKKLPDYSLLTACLYVHVGKLLNSASPNFLQSPG